MQFTLWTKVDVFLTNNISPFSNATVTLALIWGTYSIPVVSNNQLDHLEPTETFSLYHYGTLKDKL